MSTQTRGRVRVEDGHKRIRAQIAGVTVADSANAKMVWEIPYFPTYYFPPGSVRMDLLSDSGETKRSPARGTANVLDFTVGDRTIAHAGMHWNEGQIEEVRGYVSFEWDAMDAWFEEDEEVFVHARNPYTRIDILKSSRNVRVEVDGVTIADSDKPLMLFETGLPVRYYLPRTDVHFEYLKETETATSCPYKGTARYWSVQTTGKVHEDVLWSYDTPLRESEEIARYVAFYNEKLDIYVEGELEEKPRSPFG